MSNTGDLVNENDIKCDYDENINSNVNLVNLTQHISYKQIFGETIRFIKENTPYLQYPMLYLNSKQIKCNDIKNCKQCNDSSGTDGKLNVFNIQFNLCKNKRREMGNELFAVASARQCVSQSLFTSATKLFVCDEAMLQLTIKLVC